MDEVRIYDRVLNAGEISAYYHDTAGYYHSDELVLTAQETTLQDGLVARYSFDAGDVTDESGNGHDGTVYGGVSYEE